MTNIAHASMTGSQLHEPKGVDTAALGTVYVANGSGSGSWNSVGTSAFTGMIADFAAPIPPTGWLELNGATINTTTFNALYSVLSITTSGTRTSGSAVVTSIPDTSNFSVGYFVFGTGIASGTTILSIDSGSQITLSGNASATSSTPFAVSPCLMNTGTIQLPDLTTAGRYRRSRTSGSKVGDTQASQNLAHTHAMSGQPGLGNLQMDTQGQHSHTYSDPGHSHSHNAAANFGGGVGVTGGGSFNLNGPAAATINSATTGITIIANGAHVHNLGGNPSLGSLATITSGGTEARPSTFVVMTCIKT